MPCFSTRMVVALALVFAAAIPPHLAWAQTQASKQRYDEAMRSAQQSEMLGYVLGAAGILLVLAAIPVSIYMDRKKKAAKRNP